MARLITLLAVIGIISPSIGADPTRPRLDVPKTTQKKVRQASVAQPLTAIFTKGNQRFAVIENKIYRQGDAYRENKVIKITDTTVILRGAEGTRRLTLIKKIKK